MIGSQAITMMKGRLQRGTAGSPTLDALILLELQAAQLRLEEAPTLPDFLITEESSQVVIEGEARVAIPDDFIREVESDAMQVENTEVVPSTKTTLTKDFYDAIRYRYASDVEMPRKYALSGGYFRLRPVPNKGTYLLWMTYYAHDVLVTLNDANRWLTYNPDLLMSEAGVVVATSLGNEKALSLFSNLRAEAMKLLAVNTIAREMANFEPNPED